MHPTDRLFEEVAFVAYYFNWSHDDILDLPHWERHRWCDEISTINEEVNESNEEPPGPPSEPSLDDIPVLDVDEEIE